MERKTITFEELQKIIEVMQNYDDIESAEKAKGKLAKSANLNGHVKKLGGSQIDKDPLYKDFFFYNRAEILVIKKLTVKGPPKKTQSMRRGEYHLDIQSGYDIIFDDLIFEPSKSASPRFIIKALSVKRIIFLKCNFEHLFLKIYINYLRFGTEISIYKSKFFGPVFFFLYSERLTIHRFPSKINLNGNFFKSRLRISDLISSLDKSDFPKAIETIQNYSLNLMNNEIDDLKIHHVQESNCKLSCQSENEIGQFVISGKHPKIMSWGFRERITLEKHKNWMNKSGSKVMALRREERYKNAIEENRSTFMNFRNQAIEDGNRLNEVLFQYNIIECDEALIGLEPKKTSWQDRITMFVGRKISNHGTSWAKPFLAILLINFIIAMLSTFPIIAIYLMILIAPIALTVSTTASVLLIISTPMLAYIPIAPYFCCESFPDAGFGFLSLYFELFNPLVTLNNIADKTCLLEESWWLSLLTIFNKLFYSICIYEFLRAARRFTPR